MNRPGLAATATAMLALGALIAACGGGDSDPAPTATGAPSTATRAASSPTVASTNVASVPTAPAAEATSTAGAANTPVPQPTQPQPVPTKPQPQPTLPPPPPPPPTQPPAAISLTVVAKSLRFSPTRLTAPAFSTLSITLDNKDADTPHDIEFSDPSGAAVAATEIFNGPAVQTVTFSVGTAGAYDYTCSVHPFQMTGTLTVQ